MHARFHLAGATVQKQFWEASKWLPVGGLLALRGLQSPGDTGAAAVASANASDALILVEIIGRDADELAELATRARVRVAFCHDADAVAVLSVLAAAKAQRVHRNDPDYGRVEDWLMEADDPQFDKLIPVHAKLGDAVQISSNFGVTRPVLQALQAPALAEPPFARELLGGQHGADELAALAVPEPEWRQDNATREWLEQQLARMDGAQRAAFDSAVTRRVALIQGPPGVPCLWCNCALHLQADVNWWLPAEPSPDKRWRWQQAARPLMVLCILHNLLCAAQTDASPN